MSQASKLQDEAWEAHTRVAALRVEADREQSALGAVMARRRGGQMMAFAGIALILAGVAAEIMWGKAGLYILATLGLLVGFIGLMRAAR